MEKPWAFYLQDIDSNSIPYSLQLKVTLTFSYICTFFFRQIAANGNT